MTSETIRDPVKDQLLTPQNSALIIIDYQPVQVTSVASMDRQKLVSNVVAVAPGAGAPNFLGIPGEWSLWLLFLQDSSSSSARATPRWTACGLFASCDLLKAAA